MSELSNGMGRTVLFVSHHIGAVAKLCNKGIIMERGKILTRQCPIEEAVGKYKEMLGVQ
jgi:lipopolysaccharide transport system ATP-binding protein